MAKKKERILINILPPPGDFGSCGWFYTEGVGEYFCYWNGEKKCVTEVICNNCPHDESMTRQEAIERMAKAMAADDTIVEGYYEMAEAALNALLKTVTNCNQ